MAPCFLRQTPPGGNGGVIPPVRGINRCNQVATKRPPNQLSGICMWLFNFDFKEPATRAEPWKLIGLITQSGGGKVAGWPLFSRPIIRLKGLLTSDSERCKLQATCNYPESLSLSSTRSTICTPRALASTRMAYVSGPLALRRGADGGWLARNGVQGCLNVRPSSHGRITP